jgi:hypothetical protein
MVKLYEPETKHVLCNPDQVGAGGEDGILHMVRPHKCSTIGLEGNRSRDSGLSIKGRDCEHGKTSVLDLGSATACQGLFALVLGEVKGIVKSRDHVLGK